MARLKAAPQRLRTLPDRISRPDPTDAARSRARDARLAWRAWYKTARWQRLRWQVLVRDGFTCAMCGRVEGKTALLVCDHVERHGGDPDRFWGGPFQTLCKPCHDGAKQRQEAAAARGGGRVKTSGSSRA